jgi:hypothetical protein
VRIVCSGRYLLEGDVFSEENKRSDDGNQHCELVHKGQDLTTQPHGIQTNGYFGGKCVVGWAIKRDQTQI